MSVDILSQLWDIILLHGAEANILLEICYQIMISSKDKLGSKNLEEH